MLVKTFQDSWIEFPEVGKVGFIVARSDGTFPQNRLAPNLDEFVMLQ
jgi:hypothetical protein